MRRRADPIRCIYALSHLRMLPLAPAIRPAVGVMSDGGKLEFSTTSYLASPQESKLLSSPSL